MKNVPEIAENDVLILSSDRPPSDPANIMDGSDTNSVSHQNSGPHAQVLCTHHTHGQPRWAVDVISVSDETTLDDRYEANPKPPEEGTGPTS